MQATDVIAAVRQHLDAVTRVLEQRHAVVVLTCVYVERHVILRALTALEVTDALHVDEHVLVGV